MKLPRCGNSNSHHYHFNASSSSSSTAAAGALQGRAEDDERNNNTMKMDTKTRATKPTAPSSSSSNGQVHVVRRCQSANTSAAIAATTATSRRHPLPSVGDAYIRKSRSHNDSKMTTTTTTNNHLLHFYRPSCSRAKEAVVDEDIDEDDEPSGVRTPELPIPAPTSHSHERSGGGTGDGTGGNVDEGDLTRMYDFATWNMYERIVSARRQRLTSTAVSGTSTSSTTSVATAGISSSQAPSRKKNHAMEGGESKRQACEEKNGGQQCNDGRATSSSFSWLTQGFKSSDRSAKIHGSSAVTVAAVASASSEAAVAAMTSSKPQLDCKRSSIVSDCESATLATADETDKSSTTSSSWSRTDSPGTFPAVGGPGGGFGGGNEAFLNPLRTAGNGSNPNCRTSYYHPTMVDHHNNRHPAGFYTNIGGSSMMMNGGVCLGGITTSSGVALPERLSPFLASHEDDNFIFQLEM